MPHHTLLRGTSLIMAPPLTCVGVQVEQDAADARGVTQHGGGRPLQVRSQQGYATLQAGGATAAAG